MIGYVKRINDATLRVPIGGVRIGSAKYSRLAQINLKTHIITFSRYAIENVPERGRRYLVIHELAHVKEASHNKHFWELVGEHEPNYKQVGKELDRAFHENVKSDLRRSRRDAEIPAQGKLFPSTLRDDDYFDNLKEDAHTETDLDDNEVDEAFEELKNLVIRTKAFGFPTDGSNQLPVMHLANAGLQYPLDSGIITPDEYFNCNDGDFDSWQQLENGIVFGGSSEELPAGLNEDYFDHL